jgi:methylenetetrahydrofolate reductase (NADPH)
MVDISFEFFPPKTEAGRANLDTVARSLSAFGPDFVSVTYGAGGTDRDRTIDTVGSLVERLDVPVAAHLTTIGATAAELQATIDEVAELGVRHLVALRGDQPEGDHRDPAYRSATELVAAIRARPDGGSFDISVAAYPETHPRAASPRADLDNLRAKLDAGADRAISQFFFDPEIYLRFVDRARAAGVTQPLAPGIMPVTNFAGISRFAGRCGSSVPAWLSDLLAGLDGDPELQAPVAASVVIEQCRRLVAEGVDHLHFYTMNRRPLPAAACHALGLRSASLATSGRTP